MRRHYSRAQRGRISYTIECRPPADIRPAKVTDQSTRHRSLFAWHLGKRTIRAGYRELHLQRNVGSVEYLQHGNQCAPDDFGIRQPNWSLLYTVVTPDTLYCIVILQHQQWSNQQLLEVMYRDFPDLTKAGTFKSSTLKPQGLAVNHTDNEVQQLRNAEVNAITQRTDGSIMKGPGGGMNLNRKKGQKSAKVSNANIYVRKVLQDAEDTLNEQAVEAGVPTGHEVHLVEENGQLIVKDASGAFRAELPQIMKPLC